MSTTKTLSCLCLGPTGSGKTMLIKKLLGEEVIDEATSSVPTAGSNLTSLPLSNNKIAVIREVGGVMAPLWTQYYDDGSRLIYVVDASNLCQISAAGVLLYALLAEPKLRKSKVLLVLSKTDASYRQMRNEALLIMQMARLKQEVPQPITILEASAFTGEGIKNIQDWLMGAYVPPKNDKMNHPTK